MRTLVPSVPHTTIARKPSAARQRLLDAAAHLFYAEGVHTVGVDRVIDEARVTRATFYRHFPGKEDLVVAYVQDRDAAERARVAALQDRIDDPAALLAAIVDDVAAQLTGRGFRGCPFVNIAAEYPDPASRVRMAAARHRTWFHDTVAGLLARTGHPDPTYATELLIMLRDGAQEAAYLDDGQAAREMFVRAAGSVVTH